MAYSESFEISKIKFFVKIVNGFQPFIIFAKNSILDVWQRSEYASDSRHYYNYMVCPYVETLLYWAVLIFSFYHVMSPLS